MVYIKQKQYIYKVVIKKEDLKRENGGGRSDVWKNRECLRYATRPKTSNVFDEEREREVNRIFCAGECYQYLAERDKMQVQTVVL